MTAARECWRVRAGDVAVTMSAPTGFAATQRRHLAQYLAEPKPSDPADAGAVAHFRLDVHLDPVALRRFAYAAARGPGAHPVEYVDGVVLLETRRASGTRLLTVVADALEHQEGAYAIVIRGTRIGLFLDPRSTVRDRYPLRVIRELMLRSHENVGQVVFHAGGVDAGGAGIMVCGPRSSGKTTTLGHLLAVTGGRLLSNDRLIVACTGRATAVPLPVPVARGTIDALPQLRAVITDSTAIDGLDAGFGTTAKLRMPANAFARAFHAGLATASPLAAIVAPQLSDTTEPVRVRPLSPRETARHLTACCFTPRDEFWTRPWLIDRDHTDPQLRRNAASIVAHLAETIPCVQVSAGVHGETRRLSHALYEIARSAR